MFTNEEEVRSFVEKAQNDFVASMHWSDKTSRYTQGQMKDLMLGNLNGLAAMICHRLIRVKPKITIEVRDEEEGQAIKTALSDNMARATVVVIGTLLGLPPSERLQAIVKARGLLG